MSIIYYGNEIWTISLQMKRKLRVAQMALQMPKIRWGTCEEQRCFQESGNKRICCA